MSTATMVEYDQPMMDYSQMTDVDVPMHGTSQMGSWLRSEVSMDEDGLMDAQDDHGHSQAQASSLDVDIDLLDADGDVEVDMEPYEVQSVECEMTDAATDQMHAEPELVDFDIPDASQVHSPAFRATGAEHVQISPESFGDITGPSAVFTETTTAPVLPSQYGSAPVSGLEGSPVVSSSHDFLKPLEAVMSPVDATGSSANYSQHESLSAHASYDSHPPVSQATESFHSGAGQIPEAQGEEHVRREDYHGSGEEASTATVEPYEYHDNTGSSFDVHHPDVEYPEVEASVEQVEVAHAAGQPLTDESADVSHGDTEGAGVQYDGVNHHQRQEQSTDHGHVEADPHETSEDVFIEPPPSVPVTVSTGVSSAECVFFSQSASSRRASVDESFEEPALLLQDCPMVFYEPLSNLFQALRQDPSLSQITELMEGELVLSAPGLQLTVPEDNVHAREVSLHDLDLLHAGHRLSGPLRLRLTADVPRFINRYRELRNQIAHLVLDDDSVEYYGEEQQTESVPQAEEVHEHGDEEQQQDQGQDSVHHSPALDEHDSEQDFSNEDPQAGNDNVPDEQFDNEDHQATVVEQAQEQTTEAFESQAQVEEHHQHESVQDDEAGEFRSPSPDKEQVDFEEPEERQPILENSEAEQTERAAENDKSTEEENPAPVHDAIRDHGNSGVEVPEIDAAAYGEPGEYETTEETGAAGYDGDAPEDLDGEQSGEDGQPSDFADDEFGELDVTDEPEPLNESLSSGSPRIVVNDEDGLADYVEEGDQTTDLHLGDFEEHQQTEVTGHERSDEHVDTNLSNAGSFSDEDDLIDPPDGDDLIDPPDEDESGSNFLRASGVENSVTDPSAKAEPSKLESSQTDPQFFDDDLDDGDWEDETVEDEAEAAKPAKPAKPASVQTERSGTLSSGSSNKVTKRDYDETGFGDDLEDYEPPESPDSKRSRVM